MDDNGIYKKQLRKFMTRKFSKDELKVLCFDLRLDYEEFGNGKRVLVVDLLSYLIRKGKLDLLEDWLTDEGMEM